MPIAMPMAITIAAVLVCTIDLTKTVDFLSLHRLHCLHYNAWWRWLDANPVFDPPCG